MQHLISIDINWCSTFTVILCNTAWYQMAAVRIMVQLELQRQWGLLQLHLRPGFASEVNLLRPQLTGGPNTSNHSWSLEGSCRPNSQLDTSSAEAQRSVAHDMLLEASWSHVSWACACDKCDDAESIWISCQCDFKLNTSIASQHQLLRKLLVEWIECAHIVFSLHNLGTGRVRSSVLMEIQTSELQNPRNRQGQWSSPRDA